MNSNCSNLLDLRNLQEQVLCDLKFFENSRPSALNFKKFSWSLEHFFLTVGQNNFGNKIPFLNNVGHIWFPFRKCFFGENYILKKMQFRTILFPYKKCISEKRTLLIGSMPSILMVFLSILFNKLLGPGGAHFSNKQAT